MPDKVLITFLGVEFLFLATGAIILAVFMLFRPGAHNNIMGSDAATMLLLGQTPLTAALVNAIVIFITFGMALPGILMAKDRLFLRIHSYMVLLCTLITLVLGLTIWFTTLQTRANLSVMWARQTAQVYASPVLGPTECDADILIVFLLWLSIVDISIFRTRLDLSQRTYRRLDGRVHACFQQLCQ
jgi:hypothetical protein